MEFDFDRSVAEEKAQRYLAREFGPEDLTSRWDLESPGFAAILISEEEAHGNCLPADRYVIVQYVAKEPTGRSTFLVFRVSPTSNWEERLWIGTVLSLSHVIGQLRSGEACC